jgi:hypothetical protein
LRVAAAAAGPKLKLLLEYELVRAELLFRLANMDAKERGSVMKSLGIVWLLMLMVISAAAADEPDAATLVSWMTGSFSSAAQAAADSAYYDIRLEMAPIWTERDDALWLYVEQAVAGMTDRPYRQRVYRVSQGPDGVFASAVYTLPDPAQLVGAWRQDQPLEGLTPEDLELREGCTVFLRYDGEGRFSGGTEGDGCLSGLRGAAYATSEVTVGPGLIESWDRGFDAEGNQVWGAEKGAYVFLRNPQ